MAKKNKTNKSIAKRFKVTGTGKLVYHHPGKRHINGKMAPKRSRQLNKSAVATRAVELSEKEIAMGKKDWVDTGTAKAYKKLIKV